MRSVGLEGSWFHGREPDENRLDLDLGPLDSWSLRASWSSGPWQAQVSGAQLEQPEWIHPYDESRLTASVGYTGRWGSRPLAALLAWGQKREPFGIFDAYLLEGHLLLRGRHALVARAELDDQEHPRRRDTPAGIPALPPAFADWRADGRLRARPGRRQLRAVRRRRRPHGLSRAAEPDRELRAATVVSRVRPLRHPGRVRTCPPLMRGTASRSLEGLTPSESPTAPRPPRDRCRRTSRPCR